MQRAKSFVAGIPCGLGAKQRPTSSHNVSRHFGFVAPGSVPYSCYRTWRHELPVLYDLLTCKLRGEKGCADSPSSSIQGHVLQAPMLKAGCCTVLEHLEVARPTPGSHSMRMKYLKSNYFERRLASKYMHTHTQTCLVQTALGDTRTLAKLLPKREVGRTQEVHGVCSVRARGRHWP